MGGKGRKVDRVSGRERVCRGEFIRIRKKRRERKYSLSSSPENSFTIRKHLPEPEDTTLQRGRVSRERDDEKWHEEELKLLERRLTRACTEKNSLFVLVVSPYRPDASSLPSPSVCLLLFYFFLLSRLQTGILHQRRVGLMVDAPQTHSSLHYLSLFSPFSPPHWSARAFFFLPQQL